MALNLGELYGKIGMDIGPFQAGLDKAKDQLKDFSGSAPKVAAIAGLAVGAAIGAAVVKGIALEPARDKMAAGLGATGADAERIGKAAAGAYSNAWGDSMEDVTAATGAVVSSIKGLRTASSEEIQGMTEKVLAFSDAFEIDVARAAQVAGQMVNSGLVDNATQGLDLLTVAMQKVPAAVREDVMDAVDEYGPFFSQIGIKGDQAMGMLVKASEKGMYGIDKTGDAIKEFTIRATDMSKSTTDAYKSIGLDATAMTNDLLAGGDRGKSAMDKIIGGIRGIKDPAAQSQAALALFGTPIEDLGTSEIPKFLESLQTTTDVMGDTTGATQKMADQMGDNAQSNLISFGRQLETFAVDTLGGKLIPVVNDAAKWIKDNIVPGLKDLANWAKENSTVIGSFAVTLGVLTLGLMALNLQQTILAAGGLVKWFKALTTVTRLQAAATALLNLVMNANVFALVVLAIAALVAGLVYAYQHSEKFRDIVNGVWAAVKGAVMAAVSWIVDTAVPWIVDAWNSIGQGAKDLWDTVSGAFSTGVEAVKGFFTGLWEGIKGVWSGLGDFFTGLWDSLKSGAQSGTSAVGDFFVGLWEGIKNGVITAFDFLKDVFLKWTPLGQLITHWDQIKAFFLSWGEWFSSVFAAMWGILNVIIETPIRLAMMGIQWAWGQIQQAFWTVWSWISGVFMASWNTLAPLVTGVMDSVWRGIVAVWNLITSAFMAAWNWVAGVFMASWNVLTTLVGGVMTRVWQGIVNVWNLITGAFSAAWTWVATTFMGWWNSLIGLIQSVNYAIYNTIVMLWTKIMAAFSAAWQWVAGVFMGWWGTLTTLVGNVMRAVGDGIVGAWNWIKDTFTNAWNWVSNTFMGWWNAITGMIQRPIDAARDAVGRALDGIKTGFQKAVDFIREWWDKLGGIIKSPIRIGADAINLLVNGFRKIGLAVGMDEGKLPKTIDYPPGFVSGGYTGDGGKYMPAGIVHGREYVLDAETVARAGGPRVFDAYRSQILHGPISSRDVMPPGFAGGGYVWPVPGFRQTRGPHGVDRGVDIAAPSGTPVVAARNSQVTKTAAWNYSYGNHIRTSDGAIYAHLSRIATQLGAAVKGGQLIGNVGSTGNSTGPHLHFVSGGGLAGPIGAALAGAGNALQDMFGGFGSPGEWMKDLGGKALAGLNKLGDSTLGQMVTRVPKSLLDGMVSKVGEMISSFADPGGTGVERWTELVKKVLGELGLPQDGAYVGAWLRQIKSESGGNPSIRQGVKDVNSGGNEAQGLVQVIPGTFAAYRNPLLPNDRNDPHANLYAGVNYALHRYGRAGMLRVIGHGHGYADGTLNATRGFHPISEREPEVVLPGGGMRYFNGNEQVLKAKDMFNQQGDFYYQPNVDSSRDLRVEFQDVMYEFSKQTRRKVGAA